MPILVHKKKKYAPFNAWLRLGVHGYGGCHGHNIEDNADSPRLCAFPAHVDHSARRKEKFK